VSVWLVDQVVKMLNPGLPAVECNPGQVGNTHVPLSASGIIRLDALASSVIATATWLAGWLSHSGIVSKPLNLSENFFDRLKAPSL